MSCVVLCLTVLIALVVIRLVGCAGSPRTGVGGVRGVSGAPIVSVTPSAISFGNETVGTTSARQSVTISNQGQAELSVSEVSIVPSEFRISGPTPPITIPPGSSVTYSVTFAPDAAQALSGFVTVTSNASNGIAKTSLSGTGILQSTVLNVLPDAISFRSQLVNTTSSAQDILITNGGSTAITLASVQTSAPFAVAGFNGSTALNPAQGLILSVTFTPTAQTSYTGSLTITSSAPSSPNSVSVSGAGGPVCGQPDDGLAHLPPTYTTFTSPARGQSYVDPVFGCTVTRLTDVSNERPTGTGKFLGIHHYYSTVSPMNADDTMILLGDSWGNWFIVDPVGNPITAAGSWPNPVPFGSQPVWDRTQVNVLYYTSGNSVYQATVNKTAGTITTTTLFTFFEYDNVVMMDEPDLSEDGDHLALVGHNANNTLDVFSWSISQHTKLNPYTTSTSCTAAAPLGNQPGCLHKLQLTPTNGLYITFNASGSASGTESGGEVWDGTALRCVQFDSTGNCGSNHADTGYDLSGNPILIEARDGLADSCPNRGGSDIVNIANLSLLTRSCVVDINWASTHTSYRGSSSQPWVAISFFDTRTPGPEFFNNDARFVAPTTTQTVTTSGTSWYHFEDEILLVRVDANNNARSVYRLAQARARSMENFWATARASISRDGKYVIFGSNMAFPNGCRATMTDPTDCADVYLIKVQ